MAPDIRRRIIRFSLLVWPALFWFGAAMYLSALSPGSITWLHLSHWIRLTPSHPVLLSALGLGVFVSLIMALSLKRFIKSKGFDGAGYKKYIRGTKIVPIKKLIRLCKERGRHQVKVAGVPMPTTVENLHILLNGATGTGKS